MTRSRLLAVRIDPETDLNLDEVEGKVPGRPALCLTVAVGFARLRRPGLLSRVFDGGPYHAYADYNIYLEPLRETDRGSRISVLPREDPDRRLALYSASGVRTPLKADLDRLRALFVDTSVAAGLARDDAYVVHARFTSEELRGCRTGRYRVIFSGNLDGPHGALEVGTLLVCRGRRAPVGGPP